MTVQPTTTQLATAGPTRVITGGVDTHQLLHHVAVIDEHLDQIADREFPATESGYRVREGHRLVLAVFSSDFPEFVPHPGKGDNRWTATETVTSTQTLHPGATLTFWHLPGD
jgi:predicted acyl esterase